MGSYGVHGVAGIKSLGKHQVLSGCRWQWAGKRIRHLTAIHGGAAMEVGTSELLP